MGLQDPNPIPSTCSRSRASFVRRQAKILLDSILFFTSNVRSELMLPLVQLLCRQPVRLARARKACPGFLFKHPIERGAPLCMMALKGHRGNVRRTSMAMA